MLASLEAGQAAEIRSGSPPPVGSHQKRRQKIERMKRLKGANELDSGRQRVESPPQQKNQNQQQQQQQPHARRRRKEASKDFTCQIRITQLGLLLLLLLAPLSLATCQRQQQQQPTVTSSQPIDQLQRQQPQPASNSTRNRNDDISMINDTQPPEPQEQQQQPAAAAAARHLQERRPASATRKSSGAPVDVYEINQYSYSPTAPAAQEDKTVHVVVSSRHETRKLPFKQPSDKVQSRGALSGGGGGGGAERRERRRQTRADADRSPREANFSQREPTLNTSSIATARKITPMEAKADEQQGEQQQQQQQQQQGEQQRQQGETTNLKCRLEKDWYMEFEQYKHYTCANCYSLLPDDLFSRKLIFRKELKGLLLQLEDPSSGRSLMPNDTESIKGTFKTERTFNQWQECCKQAIECCRRNSIYLPRTSDSSGNLVDDSGKQNVVCPATWDGFDCWPDSPAGQQAKHDCPLHVYFLEFMPICIGQVTKECFANGSWYVRNGHEWSNFSRCNGLEIYTHRMIIGSGLHLLSVLVIGPALLILGRMRHRFGTRRVRILRWLLFWLLLNGLFAATQKIGIILGVFHANPATDRQLVAPARGPATLAVATNNTVQPPPPPLPADDQKSSTSSAESWRSVRAVPISGNVAATAGGWPRWRTPAESAYLASQGQLDSWATPELRLRLEKLEETRLMYTQDDELGNKLDAYESAAAAAASRHLDGSGGRRRRRLVERSASGGYSRRSQQSFLIVLFCWIVSVGIRITRLFGYGWMFTSAVYLCSVLHFSPAEPPPLFMNWLMFSTHAFPVVIGTIYVIVRSIYDPSPLTLLFKLPYYYAQGDMDYVNYLKDTQLDCWMLQSKLDSIEDIADWPNAVLVILNTALFVITLIIMCRFKKLPGSTRPETSLWGYFKAAGMLVFLYGAHYLLIAYTPRVEGCTINQVMYYAMLLVDGIQGVAISLVFCYRTSAGNEVICKWWKNMQDEYECRWMNLCHRKPQRQTTNSNNNNNNNQRSELLKQSSRSNRSTRGSNSVCNGKDTITELSNINANNF